MAAIPVLIKSLSANEITIGLARIVIAVLVLTPLLLLQGKLKGLCRRDWWGMLIIGGCFAGHWLTYFSSIKLATASLGAIAVTTFGIHLLFLNWLIKGQRIRPSEWLAVLLCFSGCLLVTPEFSLANNITLGLLSGVFSGLLYACLPLLHQRISHIGTLTRAWGQFAFAGLFFLPFIGFSHWQLSADDWWRLLALGLVGTVIAHSLWVKASTELPAIYTSLIYYLYVPIAMLLSSLFLQEEITVEMISGTCLIIGANLGLAILDWRRSKHRA